MFIMPILIRDGLRITTDEQGNEKVLDGVWVDQLQNLLDEAARAYGAKNEWQDEKRRQDREGLGTRILEGFHGFHAFQGPGMRFRAYFHMSPRRKRNALIGGDDAFSKPFLLCEEQKELVGEIGSRFARFYTSGSESIDAILAELLPVWRVLGSPEKMEGLEGSDLDVQGWLAAALGALKEAREKGTKQAEKVTEQWFAFLSQEVYHVEEFGNAKVKDLQHLKPSGRA